MNQQQTGIRGLVVIDVQRGLIEGAEECWVDVLPTIAALISGARTAQAPVVFVQHCGGAGHPLEKGSKGWALDPAVTPTADETVIEKRYSDAFAETDLADVLAAEGVGEVVITGAQTEYCVDATVRAAASRGLRVLLVEDGHTTSQSPMLTREQIITHHNRTLSQLPARGEIRVAAAVHVSFGDRT